jgi:hypothetical protein
MAGQGSETTFGIMTKVLLFLLLVFVLAGCGSTTPCDESDPVGICANARHPVPTGA